MKILKSISALQSWRKNLGPATLGFVPTMGALHEGHLNLVKKSQQKNKFTLVSIFVNPTQFNHSDDFKKYPSTLEQDLKHLRKSGAAAVFLPTQKMLYPDNFHFRVCEDDDSKVLCGAHRAGHFTGVLTVVLKLLNLARADSAFFGEKDYQQLQLVKGLSEAFFVGTKIVPVKTLREKSGLAMSSRNVRLAGSTQKKAALIYSLLSTPGLEPKDIESTLQKNGFDVDYVEDRWQRRFVAAHIDGVRLIDNIEIKNLKGEPHDSHT